MNKAEVRATMQRFLASLDPGDAAARSRAAARRFQALDAWADADILFCFLSMPREILTDPLVRGALEIGRPVAVPRIEGGEIRFLTMPADGRLPGRDRWGIPVPDPGWSAVDPARAGRVLVAAPGLAFDRAGNRLGRGRGFYDRFLARARASGATLTVIGLCFQEQLLPDVPHEAWDAPLDGVVTDAETVLVQTVRP